MSIVDKLENLECLKNGLHKKWIWNDADSFSLSCDYLQKINYCIQDLNSEIGSLSNPSMKEVIFVIVLVDWICEAVDCLPKLLIPDLRDGFSCEYESELEKAKKYFKAIRSFVGAHPLTTNRHYDYGFDGDLICVDIGKISILVSTFTNDSDWYHIDFSGLRANAKNENHDFILHVYSQKKNGMKFENYIGANFSDLFEVARTYMKKIYALDRYLSKQRKKGR